MNALSKINETTRETKEGPVFIYSYVPLTKEQKASENIREANLNIFAEE